MFTDLTEWNRLKGSGIDELLWELVSENEKIQRVAAEALDYRLLSLGADRDENYGDPKLLLNNNLLLDATPVLIKIVSVDTFNTLSKVLALFLLYGIFNFSSLDTVKQYDTQKTEAIRRVITSSIPTYQGLLAHKNTEVQKYAQQLLNIIRRNN